MPTGHADYVQRPARISARSSRIERYRGGVTAPRPAISDVSDADLGSWLAARAEPAYRARQIRRHATHTKAADWSELTDLPVGLRAALADSYRWSGVTPVIEQASADGETRKALLQLHDGQRIETVLMPHHGMRNSVCISTQAGCPMACAFCATGEMGLIRNLTPGEIVDQVRHWQYLLAARRERVSHVVYMGMGEPFNNYDATIASARELIAADGFGVSPRRLTISTCGVVPKIDALAAEGLPINLAVSLHAADDETRGSIMPINRKWGIDEVLAASARYVARTKRRVTFEYVLLAGVNDSAAAAHELARRIGRAGRTSDYHVNLIPVNAGPGGFRRPAVETMEKFAAVLTAHGIAATVRISKGQDIAAGCGQLKVDEKPAGEVV